MMKRNGGFSLIELMVAMVIGLVITLGAGQLFLTVFQTSRQVDVLSEKQAAVNFTVETLLRDIRRADEGDIDWDDGVLSLTVLNRGDILSNCNPGEKVYKKYRLSDKEVNPQAGSGWAIEMKQDCSGSSDGVFQQLVAAFSDEGFYADDSKKGEGIWVITIKLMKTSDDGAPDPLTFYAVNRTAAITNYNGGG